MTEGEFYKKLIFGDMEWHLGDIITAYDIKKILDGAKKEFPVKLKKDEWLFVDKTPLVNAEQLIAVLNWFRKWFGDNQP